MGAEAAGSWDVVAIATDFDGFADPPDDCPDASHLPGVGEMLARRLSAADAAAVLGGDARRVLRRGWR